MESEKENNRRLYPEFAALVDANRGHITAAAIIDDGEVISGRMPADDYKLAWLSAEGWDSARKYQPPGKASKSERKYK